MICYSSDKCTIITMCVCVDVCVCVWVCVCMWLCVDVLDGVCVCGCLSV